MKRPLRRCFLLLGSNQGDREKILNRAFSDLGRLPGCKVLRRSRYYQTAAFGKKGRPYLNAAAEIKTSLSAMGLLIEAKRLEALAGRKPGPRWGPRPLDIDILSYGRNKISTRWLRVPHPLLRRRAFALAPLAELAPSWKPGAGATVASLLARLNPGPGTVRIFRDER